MFTALFLSRGSCPAARTTNRSHCKSRRLPLKFKPRSLTLLHNNNPTKPHSDWTPAMQTHLVPKETPSEDYHASLDTTHCGASLRTQMGSKNVDSHYLNEHIYSFSTI